MVRTLILFNQIIPLGEFIYTRILVPLSPSLAKLRFWSVITPRKAESLVNGAMTRMLGDAWTSRNPTEKRYILTEIIEMGNGSMEIMLLLASILAIRGLRGIIVVLLTFQYLMFRVSSNAYVEVKLEEECDGREWFGSWTRRLTGWCIIRDVLCSFVGMGW